jgi:hypothetical protein
VQQNIYLVVSFNFPKPFQPEYGEKAKVLHQALIDQDWIEDVFAASGGIGGGPSSMWVFKMDGYASLDRLFDGSDPVSKAYVAFFRTMDDVQDMVREEVVFSG